MCANAAGQKLVPLSIVPRVKPIQALDDKNEMKFAYATKGIIKVKVMNIKLFSMH